MIIYNLERHLPREAGVGSLFTCFFKNKLNTENKSNKIKVSPIQSEKEQVTLLPEAEGTPPLPPPPNKRVVRNKRKNSTNIEKNTVNNENNRGKKRKKISLIEDGN